MLDHTRQYVGSEPASSLALQSLYGTAVCDDEDMSDVAAVGAEGLPRARPSASVVIKLLDRAANALNSDRAVAKDCITRASALLQAEDDRVRLARGGLAPWQVRQVTRHVDAGLASTIRVTDCAKISRFSASHFSRAFKISFGETFCNYIARRRIERAQEMMIMTDEPLSQIALCCGFADQSHFSRVYRRQVGLSPDRWRRQRGREPLMHEEPMHAGQRSRDGFQHPAPRASARTRAERYVIPG